MTALLCEVYYEREISSTFSACTDQPSVLGSSLLPPRFRSGEEDSTFVAANGSYIFPNITQQNSSYASGSGVEYYCTATNSFGTIRSRTVRAFYACELGGTM